MAVPWILEIATILRLFVRNSTGSNFVVGLDHSCKENTKEATTAIPKGNTGGGTNTLSSVKTGASSRVRKMQ